MLVGTPAAANSRIVSRRLVGVLALGSKALDNLWSSVVSEMQTRARPLSAMDDKMSISRKMRLISQLPTRQLPLLMVA